MTIPVTPKDGHPQRPTNKAKADGLSRPLDSVSQARAGTPGKKKAKEKKAKKKVEEKVEKKIERRPCIIPGVQRLYSVKEAASYLRLSIWTVRSLGWKKEIPEVKIRRRVLYDRQDLDHYIEGAKT